MYILGGVLLIALVYALVCLAVFALPFAAIVLIVNMIYNRGAIDFRVKRKEVKRQERDNRIKLPGALFK